MAAIAGSWLCGPLHAQTLEEQYRLFLGQKCRNLGFARDEGGELLAGQAGPNLTAFCADPDIPIVGDSSSGPGPTTTVSAPGGGAGAAAGRASLDQEPLRTRQDDARSDQATESSESPTAAVRFRAGRAAGFVSLDRHNERQKTTYYEDGRRSQSLAATLGADYRFGRAVMGAALSYLDVSGDFTGGGEFDARGRGAWLYGSWLPHERAFVDFSVSADVKDYRAQRLVGLRTVTEFSNRTSISIDPPLRFTDGSTDSRDRGAEASGGFDFVLGSVTLGPRAALNVRRTTIDGFTESGPTPMTLAFDAQTIRSQRASLGLQASRALNLQQGAIVMQVNLDWLRELENDQRVMTARFAEDLRPNAPRMSFLSQPPDRNWHSFRASVVAVFSNRLSAFVSLDSTFGHAYLDSYGASIGVRREFE